MKDHDPTRETPESIDYGSYLLERAKPGDEVAFTFSEHGQPSRRSFQLRRWLSPAGRRQLEAAEFYDADRDRIYYIFGSLTDEGRAFWELAVTFENSSGPLFVDRTDEDLATWVSRNRALAGKALVMRVPGVTFDLDYEHLANRNATVIINGKLMEPGVTSDDAELIMDELLRIEVFPNRI